MTETRDAELLEKLSGGDLRAWETLVQRHSSLVYSLSMRMLQDAQDAEDAAQETFLRVRKSAQTFRFGDDARNWIAKIASREALKIMERRSHEKEATAQREREAKSDSSTSARRRAIDAHVEEETRKSVQKAVDELPERLRAAVVLHYGAGMNQSEIAAEVGCDRTTIADRLEQGLETLRRRLSQQGITAALALSPAALAGSLTSEPVPAAVLQKLITLQNVASASVRVGAKVAAGKIAATVWAASITGVLLAGGTGVVWYKAVHPAAPKAPAAQALAKSDESKNVAAAPAELSPDPDPEAVRFEHAGKLEGHLQLITNVVFSANGKTIASSSYDHTVRLWDAASFKPVYTFKGYDLDVRCVALSSGGIMASTTGDEHKKNIPGEVQLWDLVTKKRTASFKGHTSLIDCVVFAPDGKSFVTGSWDSTIKLWNSADQQELKTLTGHSGGIATLAFSPDGKILASGSWDHTTRLWDTQTWKELRVLEGHTNRVWSLAFSPDGRRVVTGSFDGTLKIWDVSSGRATATLRGHHGMVYTVAWSPNGKVIASGSGDDNQIDKPGEAKLWDAEAGTELAALGNPAGAVFSMAFSPDGRVLTVAGGDGMTIDIWRAIPTQKVVSQK